MMTPSDILDLNSLNTAVRENTIVLEATYKAYTPWAGGCARNSTIVVENGRVADVCLPDAKGLIGRARWLGRIAVATALGKNIAMREADKPVSAVLGSTDEASSVKVLVEPLNKPGSVKQLLNKAYKSALSELDFSSKRGRNKTGPLELLLRGIANATNDKEFEELKNNDRLRLAIMGRKGLREVAAKVPLPPSLAGFRLKIYARPGMEKKRISVATALLAATPLLAGLGAITSRGFGRFCLNEYVGGKGLEDLLEELRCDSQARLSEQSAAKLVKEIHRDLGEKLKSIFKPSESPGNTPFLDYNLTTAVTLKESTYYKAINAIASAVTKQCWKSILNISILSPGANLHTWPLGLPRQQKTGGYIIDKDRRDIFCSNRPLGEPGRRLSLIHVYPLFTIGNIVNVALAVYKSRDLDKLLTNDSPRLYHVGAYIIGYQRRNNRRRPIFSDYHYVAVKTIASSRIIKDPCNTQHNEPGGIQSLHNYMQRPLLDSALMAARDFVIEGLKRCLNHE